MVYFRKILHDTKRIVYEYGENENEFIGTISLDLKKSEMQFEEQNVSLDFYEGYSFGRLTTSALQGIAKFVRENEFPDEYLRATH